MVDTRWRWTRRDGPQKVGQKVDGFTCSASEAGFTGREKISEYPRLGDVPQTMRQEQHVPGTATDLEGREDGPVVFLVDTLLHILRNNGSHSSRINCVEGLFTRQIGPRRFCRARKQALEWHVHRVWASAT